MSERTFGAEIEHSNDPWDVQDALARQFPKIPKSVWDCYEDGSGCEVHTPVLQGEDGHKLLEEIMQFLKEFGGEVYDEDGMHVHLGALDLGQNPAFLARVVRSWINVEQTVCKFISPYRRPEGFWAAANFVSQANSDLPQKIRKVKNYEQMQQEGVRWPGRRKLNIDHVLSYIWERSDHSWHDSSWIPTVEFRAHEGTLNGKEANAWIRFLKAFVDYHEDRPSLPVLKRTTTLLERLRVDDDTANILLAKEVRFAGSDEMEPPPGYDEGYYDEGDYGGYYY